MRLPMLRRSPVVSVLLVVGCVIPSVVACHKDTSAPELTGAVTTATPPGTNKPAPLADEDVAQAIRRHFQEEGPLRAASLQVAVTHGVASLSGPVGNLLTKERAVRVAESIRGVRSVIDQVTVTPVTRTDDQLRIDVSSALRKDSATRASSIGVATKDGVVTLSGTADSWQQRTLFGDVAKTVMGVRAIDNAVAVHYGTVRPESEIAADVKHRIANDLWLDGNVLGVTVTGHTVHVSGVVASAAQKTRARVDGWVAGVDTVDDGNVVVDWLAQNDQRSVVDYAMKSDADIAQAVRDAFRIDPRLKTLIPQVAVREGVVSLSGTVDSASARLGAEADAKNTVGVWSVRDQVLVQPAGKPTDADVERDTKRVLREDLLLSDGKSIKVSSAKGKVALEGAVPSSFERFDAIADVESVPGVTEIVDGLTVKRPPADIKASIDDRLFWDAMVQRDRVSVAVAPDGVATLTGTLDSWGEIKAAADDALWGGATHVVNVLKLKKHPEVVAP